VVILVFPECIDVFGVLGSNPGERWKKIAKQMFPEGEKFTPR